MRRRQFLQTSFSGISVGAFLSLLPSHVLFAKSSDRKTRLKGPMLNHDSTAFFCAYSAEQMSGALVDNWVESLAEAGVGVMLSNINAMRANYASKVWEPDWHGYDPKGGDDQPVLKHLPKEVIPLTRKRLDSAKKLAELGINFHQRAIAGCRKHGIGAWITIRMNDLHDCDLPDSPLLSTFFKEHRDWARVPNGSSWTDRALNWAHPEVREHNLKLIREALDIFDLDGLELDWMRFGYFFAPGRELEGGQILRDFMVQVRREVAKASKRLRRSVKLGVRVPSTPETARHLGLDGVAWARAGLIDVLVVTPFWATCEFNMPMSTWRRLLEGTEVTLAGGLEILYRPMPSRKPVEMSPAQAAGAAMSVLSGGGDVVYLFNYFPESKPWPVEQFNNTLRAMKNQRSLDLLPRTHAVTYRDTRAPGEPADYPLPATGTKCAFRLQTGPKPTGRKVEVLLELEGGKADTIVAPELCVNSVLCSAAPKQTASVFVYTVPEIALADETQVLEAITADGKSIKIVRVEISISSP